MKANKYTVIAADMPETEWVETDCGSFDSLEEALDRVEEDKLADWEIRRNGETVQRGRTYSFFTVEEYERRYGKAGDI